MIQLQEDEVQWGWTGRKDKYSDKERLSNLSSFLPKNLILNTKKQSISLLRYQSTFEKVSLYEKKILNIIRYTIKFLNQHHEFEDYILLHLKKCFTTKINHIFWGL